MSDDPTRDRPATAAEVVEIVGPLDDQVIARIIGTGASAADVLEAFTWLNADDYMGKLERPKIGAMAAVIDILEAEMPLPEERRPTPGGAPGGA